MLLTQKVMLFEAQTRTVICQRQSGAAFKLNYQSPLPRATSSQKPYPQQPQTISSTANVGPLLVLLLLLLLLLFTLSALVLEHKPILVSPVTPAQLALLAWPPSHVLGFSDNHLQQFKHERGIWIAGMGSR